MSLNNNLLEAAAKLLADAHETNTQFWLTGQETPTNQNQTGKLFVAGKHLARAVIAVSNTAFRDELEAMYRNLRTYHIIYKKQYNKYVNASEENGFHDETLEKFILLLNRWDGVTP